MQPVLDVFGHNQRLQSFYPLGQPLDHVRFEHIAHLWYQTQTVRQTQQAIEDFECAEWWHIGGAGPVGGVLQQTCNQLSQLVGGIDKVILAEIEMIKHVQTFLSGRRPRQQLRPDRLSE